ncbi:MAG: YdcF family protein, partial [Stackebrandtia sp.]
MNETAGLDRFGLGVQAWSDVETVWAFHHMGHDARACDAAIVLGCHDIGVANEAAEAYNRGLVPVVVVTGANSPATRDRFAEGEASAFAARMRRHGVPKAAILIEPEATNTGANITLSRRLLEEDGASVGSVLLVTMPYMERRAYATTRVVWPQVEPVCTSSPVGLGEYLSVMVERDGIEASQVIDMMVGDLQRIIEYPARGFQLHQEVPNEVHAAYKRLIDSGFDSKLIT